MNFQLNIEAHELEQLTCLVCKGTYVCILIETNYVVTKWVQ